MSLPGPVTYRIREADHYSLWRMMSRWSGSRGLAWSIGLLLLFGLVIGVAEQSVAEGLYPIGAGLLAGVAALVAYYATIKPRARKVFRESVTLHEDMTLTFHDDGFEIAQASGRFRGRWVNMVRWDENPEIMAVFPNRYSAIIFPKDQVDEDCVTHIREQMQLSGLPKPWKLRK